MPNSQEGKLVERNLKDFQSQLDKTNYQDNDNQRKCLFIMKSKEKHVSCKDYQEYKLYVSESSHLTPFVLQNYLDDFRLEY
jgi:hypothetical protein